MSPREVVERWVERFNAADADGLADLYHPDAINHQVTQKPVEGRDAIRATFEREFASADMTCIVEANVRLRQEIRRVPVTNENERVVGMVSLVDISKGARDANAWKL